MNDVIRMRYNRDSHSDRSTESLTQGNMALVVDLKSYGYSPSDVQTYCLERLREINEAWERVKPGGIAHLNRLFGYPATTQACQAMLEEARQGLVVHNPYALLWKVAETRFLNAGGQK